MIDAIAKQIFQLRNKLHIRVFYSVPEYMALFGWGLSQLDHTCLWDKSMYNILQAPEVTRLYVKIIMIYITLYVLNCMSGPM